MKPIAILGCGPAGLLAAHAVGLAGYPFSIFSKPEKSKLGGAQYLHHYIPQLTSDEPEVMIDIEARGDAETYRRKVYGDDPTVPFVSFPEEPHSQQPAWSLTRVYDQLWGIFGGNVNDVEVTPQWIEEHEDEFDIILSSIPLVHICRARAGLLKEVHTFNAQKIWVATENIYPIKGNAIIYDGTREHSWYRCSRLFEVGGTEWSTLGPRPMGLDLHMGMKPIATNCDCYPNMIRIGRYGSWTKGVLTHHAFIEALKVVLPERTGH